MTMQSPHNILLSLPEITTFETALQENQRAMERSLQAATTLAIEYAMQYEIASKKIKDSGKSFTEKEKDSFVIRSPEWVVASRYANEWAAAADARRHLVIHLRNKLEER